MRIVPLGGADEVGASCTFVELGGKRLVIDCGVRMGAAGAADPLPNLAALSDLGGVDAVVVTHAHLDHSGALPLLHRAYPAAPIYATAATHALIQIMLHDAVKVMGDRTRREHEVPLYEAEAVSALSSRAWPVPFAEPIPMLDGAVQLTLFPAGHILGAAMVALEARDGKILATGDYSVAPQRTVEGLMVPRFRPDVLITESTYGCRLHANRKVEERRLAEAVAAVVEGGGKALVPSFALGRAQEVLLILQQFQRDRAIPRFPIWVDGMVKTICGAYAGHAGSLSRSLRRRLEREGKVFFNDECQPVPLGGRDKVLQGADCAIVASSGMLTGGPSLTYAQALASDSRSAILMTGYQDEESPGRQLLAMANATPEARTLQVDGRTVPVSCQVGQYGLSAHADSGEIVGLVAGLAPQDVILVHGDSEARQGLGRLISDRRRVYLPAAGDELKFEPGGRRQFAGFAALKPGIGRGKPFDVGALRDYVAASPAARAAFTSRELAETWHGERVDDAALSACTVALQSGQAFVPDRKRPFLFRLSEMQPEVPSEPAGPMEQNRALAVVDDIFQGVAELYRKGARTESRTLVLSFHFPLVALSRYGGQIELIKERTGWNVELSGELHLGSLQAYLSSLLPGCVVLKAPSYRREEQSVLWRVGGLDARTIPALEAACLERTGILLILDQTTSGTALPNTPQRPGEPMEINSAYAQIEAALRPTGVAIGRRSKKSDLATGQSYIEVSFVSPQVGERYQVLLGQISETIGWLIRINPEPNQNAIKDRVRVLLGDSLAKEPGFFKDKRCVRVRLRGPGQDIESLSAQLEAETGYHLEVDPGK